MFLPSTFLNAQYNYCQILTIHRSGSGKADHVTGRIDMEARQRRNCARKFQPSLGKMQ